MDEPSGPARTPGGLAGLAVAAIAFLWAVFHVATAGFGALPDFQQRALHLGGALTLVFAWHPLRRRGGRADAWIDVALILVTWAATGYVVVNYDRIVTSSWFLSPDLERPLGVLLFLAVLEGVRRSLGWLFVLLILNFVFYALFGPYVPGLFGHRGVSLDRLIYTFYFGANGIFGMLMGISATVVALFLVLGEMLNAGGGGEAFIKIAMRASGRIRGGPGMVAVVSSAFMGMVNGSAVANVTSTGVLTIPLMKRLGFDRNLAGAIEATASTGGQFMPPIMGPGAFLLAELLAIPYLLVAKAALVPSLLYFFGLLLCVYLYAWKHSLRPIPKELIPSRAEAYAPLVLVNLLLPIGILIVLVAWRYTVQYAVFWAIVAVVLLMFLRTPASPRVEPTRRAAATSTVRRVVMALGTIGEGVRRAASGIAYVAMIIAAAQIVVSVINLTGLGVTFSQLVVGLGRDNTALSLALTMVITMVLGMGMPTPAAYAIAASVLGPPLAKLGFGALPSHLFLYYFACLAAISPPVAPAVFAAVALSGGNVLRTAGYALTLALSLFVIPFIFVMNTQLIMEGEAIDVALATATAAAGVAVMCCAVIGFCRRQIHPLLRLAMAAASLTLITPGLISDLFGLAVAVAAFAGHFYPELAVRMRWRTGEPSR